VPWFGFIHSFTDIIYFVGLVAGKDVARRKLSSFPKKFPRGQCLKKSRESHKKGMNAYTLKKSLKRSKMATGVRISYQKETKTNLNFKEANGLSLSRESPSDFIDSINFN